jgi:hypothetical protein
MAKGLIICRLEGRSVILAHLLSVARLHYLVLVCYAFDHTGIVESPN